MLFRDPTGKSKLTRFHPTNQLCFPRISANPDSAIWFFSLHICVTLQHTAIYEEFLEDLEDSVNTVSDPYDFLLVPGESKSIDYTGVGCR